jgi:flavin reductase (DIM6/NTAB) family NADH-FMN oxidoreductase RutF
MCEWLDESGVFAISVLPWKHQMLADRLAGLGPLVHTAFKDVPHFTAVTGSPIIQGSLAWADCTAHQNLEMGDHRNFVGQAVQIGGDEGDEPLIHFRRRYYTLKHE